MGFKQTHHADGAEEAPWAIRQAFEPDASGPAKEMKY
jgi:hypothetical protein